VTVLFITTRRHDEVNDGKIERRKKKKTTERRKSNKERRSTPPGRGHGLGGWLEVTGRSGKNREEQTREKRAVPTVENLRGKVWELLFIRDRPRSRLGSTVGLASVSLYE
jgi:hypothetical protein